MVGGHGHDSAYMHYRRAKSVTEHPVFDWLRPAVRLEDYFRDNANETQRRNRGTAIADLEPRKGLGVGLGLWLGSGWGWADVKI